MRLIIFEGTKDEFKAVEHLTYRPHTNDDRANVATSTSTGTDRQRHDAIESVLNRIPIPRGQRELFDVLNAAGENGLSQLEIADKMGRSVQQITGVLGALGHRINQTPGARIDKNEPLAISLFFLIEEVNDEWRYVMRPELREVLQQKGLL